MTNVQRAEVGNREKAALVVRLHCDASPDSGYAIYHPDRSATVQGHTGPSESVMQRSQAAAESLHVSLARRLAGKLKDGGVRGDSRTAIGAKQGALTGSVFSDVPVVLIEMVTLSNANDARFIRDAKGQSLMAQAIAEGIGRYVPASNSPRPSHDALASPRADDAALAPGCGGDLRLVRVPPGSDAPLRVRGSASNCASATSARSRSRTCSTCAATIFGARPRVSGQHAAAAGS